MSEAVKNPAIKKPEKSEYPSFFQRYVDLVGEGEFMELFRRTTDEATAFFESIPVDQHDFRYAPDKWSIKEVLMHIIDTERVFAYRALVCARGDDTITLPSMDEKLYASNVDAGSRTMDSLLEEFIVVRRSSGFILENLTEAQSKFRVRGTAGLFTARAIGYFMIGHILHHFNVVNERYLTVK